MTALGRGDVIGMICMFAMQKSFLFWVGSRRLLLVESATPETQCPPSDVLHMLLAIGVQRRCWTVLIVTHGAR